MNPMNPYYYGNPSTAPMRAQTQPRPQSQPSQPQWDPRKTPPPPPPKGGGNVRISITNPGVTGLDRSMARRATYDAQIARLQQAGMTRNPPPVR